MIKKEDSKTITFCLGDMTFEYDEWKNEYNIKHHGISFKHAARVFFDYDRIELYDEDNSETEDRYNTIGRVNEVLFVVYTERKDNIRLISARLATKKERSIYYDTNSYIR